MTKDQGVKLSLQAEMEQMTGINLDSCMQCGCCTGGCSGIEQMDYSPRQIIQRIKLNQRDLLLKSNTIWLCLSCHVCEDRCPAGIKISRLMDALRERSVSYPGVKENRQTHFHRLFLGQVKTFGRTHEGLLMMGYSLKTRAPLPPTPLIITLLARNRVNMKPPHIPAKQYRIAIKRSTKGGKDHGA